MQQVEESIARYMDALHTANRTQPVDLQAKANALPRDGVGWRSFIDPTTRNIG
jgi:hypothetical protein